MLSHAQDPKEYLNHKGLSYRTGMYVVLYVAQPPNDFIKGSQLHGDKQALLQCNFAMFGDQIQSEGRRDIILISC